MRKPRSSTLGFVTKLSALAFWASALGAGGYAAYVNRADIVYWCMNRLTEFIN
ncbi:hypothetical protein [uncultured Mediterranean phage]|nr:hypothetical protein [uncultured Mediterranean phage]